MCVGGNCPESEHPLTASAESSDTLLKSAEAEQLYRQALQKNASLLPARHNLALLLDGQKDRAKEAVDLWRENLRQSPDYLPSRLSLAGALAAQGDNAGAVEEYHKVLDAKPDYVGARIALADVLAKTNDRDGALDQLHQVTQQDSQDPELFERIGDLEAARQRPADARTAYQAALNLKPARPIRKRIDDKLKQLK